VEIWSDRDIRNGRRLAQALFAGIVAKEIAVVAALASGVVEPGTILPAGTLPFVASEALRAASAFGLSLLLMVFAYGGHGWARLGLGLNYLLLSGWIGLNALSTGEIFQTLASKLIIGNAAAGLIIGLLLIFATSLRAFAWYQATRRRTIPVPLDDQPARRTMRRKRTMGEALFAFFSTVGNLVFVAIVLALAALIYGFGDTLLHWLRP
jgi:hypothetical protein